MYKNFKPLIIKDNVEAQIESALSSTGETILLKTGHGARFPETKADATTSAGSSTTLNFTGADSLGVAVGDLVWNVTDDSIAQIVSIATDAITTTPLEGGGDNTWADGDNFCISNGDTYGPFVVTANKREGGVQTGAITTNEKILIWKRSSDTLYLNDENVDRGLDDTGPADFAPDDYINIFPEKQGRKSFINVVQNLYQKCDDLLNKAVTIAGLKTFSTAPRAGTDPVHDNDLVRKSWFLANASSGGSLTKPAGESLTPNMLLFEGSDEKWYESFEKLGVITVNNVGNGQWGTVKRIDDTHFVQFYMDYDPSWKGWVRMGEVNWATGAITYGTRVELTGLLNKTAAIPFISRVDDTTTFRLFLNVMDSTELHCQSVTVDVGTNAVTLSGSFVTKTLPIFSDNNAYAGFFCDFDNGDVALMQRDVVSTTHKLRMNFIRGATFTLDSVIPCGAADNTVVKYCSNPIPIGTDGTTVAVMYSYTGMTNFTLHIVSNSNPSVDSVDVYPYTNAYSAMALLNFNADEAVAVSPIWYNTPLASKRYTFTSTTITEENAVEFGEIGYELYGPTNSYGGNWRNQKGGTPGQLITMDSAKAVHRLTLLGGDFVSTKMIQDTTPKPEMTTTGYACYNHVEQMKPFHYASIGEDSDQKNGWTLREDTTVDAFAVSRETRSLDDALTASVIGGLHNTESGLIPGTDYILKGRVMGIVTSATEALITQGKDS